LAFYNLYNNSKDQVSHKFLIGAPLVLIAIFSYSYLMHAHAVQLSQSKTKPPVHVLQHTTSDVQGAVYNKASQNVPASSAANSSSAATATDQIHSTQANQAPARGQPATTAGYGSNVMQMQPATPQSSSAAVTLPTTPVTSKPLNVSAQLPVPVKVNLNLGF